jgi:hypothetical protein
MSPNPSPTCRLEPMTGDGTVLTGSLADVDLAGAGYTQSEWRCAGSAHAYAAPGGLGADGRWVLEPTERADFATRVVVRVPADPERSSGTVVVEWLNVSSGADAAPVWGFAGPEITRAGHTWVGVSAQWAGVVAAPALVDVGVAGLHALRRADPDRYGDLHHPGDAWCFDIYTQVTAAVVAATPDGPLGGGRVDRVLAVGESQSAYALTTYANGVQPLTGAFEGFLIHSRGGPAMPLGEAGRGVDLEDGRADPAVRIRDDLAVPVLVLQTETDVLGHLDSLASRQPDTDRLRLWEVAGSAHADRSLVGDFEEILGCAEPVNRGQQRFVVRGALRHLVDWSAGGPPPPTADRLVIEDGDAPARAERCFGTDDLGNVLGGVRTPCVDAAVEVLSGLCDPDASRVCRLFGRTVAVAPTVLRARYPSRQAYVAAYERATDAAIDAGYVLPEDRAALESYAHAELVP